MPLGERAFADNALQIDPYAEHGLFGVIHAWVPSGYLEHPHPDAGPVSRLTGILSRAIFMHCALRFV
jgi:hypothetical protein